MPSVQRSSFGTTKDGQEVELFTLTNDSGAIAKVTNFGGILTELWVPDRDGKLGDVTLGFSELEPYETNPPHFGATIGRVGNRIAEARFELDGVTYEMAQNHGAHHLHGGVRGYDKRLWSGRPLDLHDAAVVNLHLFDLDGEENYPGNVSVLVTFFLTNENTLRIEYEATTDKPTPINLTNHAYWNLRDAGASGILDHVLQLNSALITEVGEALIPTGRIVGVEGTPFDFRSAKPVGRDFGSLTNEPRGYDHNFVLDNPDGALVLAADLYEPVSGRRMQTWTTEPAVQFYTGNFLDGSLYGKGGVQYSQHRALCLETQHYPDSVNHAHFPSTILRPGETYRQATEYRFSVS